MFKKLFLAPALLGIAGLLMSAGPAFAQRGGHSGGGRSGGGRSGGSHASAAHVSGGHVSGGHVSGGRVSAGHVGGGARVGGGRVGGAYYGGGGNRGGYNRGSYGGGYYGGGYGYYPGIFGGYYPWYDTSPYYDDYPSYPYYDAPEAPYYQTPTYVQPAPIVVDPAYIRVIVPDPQARVWFDGNLTGQAGTDRLFNSPALTAGSTYSYQIRASWMQGGREVTGERTVSVTPGQTTVVDFTR